MKNRCLIWAILFVQSALTASAAAPDGPFTLEQILAAPFPSGMSAAPQGGRVAWVINHNGARNIWVAGPPEYQGKQITPWSEDDGQTLSQFSWTPDGNRIVFVRGDGANRSGELPNPLHHPGGAEQAIWIVEARGGEPKELTEGASPAVSPRGNGLAFVRQGQVWWIDFEPPEEGEELKPRQLIQARGESGQLKWSPDGAKLALTSRRGGHSYIGIYDVEANSLRFLDPSLNRDSNPAWSPDGSSIAFLRQPPSPRALLFTPRREDLPWSIRAADIASGESRSIWRADPGPGSAFRNIVAGNQIFWSADRQIVFAWEKEGWTHLYSVPASGGSARLLTPGDFEVEMVHMSADGRSVVYSSNQGDIDRRHIWQVSAAGGTPLALTSGQSNEWAPTPLSGGALALIRSSGASPAQPYILPDGSPPRLLAPGSLPDSFPEQHLVEPQQVIFSSADGMKIHGQLFLPRNIPAGEKRPAMLYFHGGSRRQMLLGWHYSSYYHNCYALNQYLASRGYVVMSVNYRSGIGYGMEFREALGYGAAGASEFNDVMGAGLYLRSRDDVDPGRIGLWGGSYGGYLTALGLARASDLFAAGVDVHGVHDWNVVIKNFVPSYNPLELQEAARLAFESSPMAGIDTWKSPVLLIHGDDDRNVPFSESVDLARALLERDVEFEQLVFPDEVHGFLLHRSWLQAFQAASSFLKKHLGR
ncbi:MAG: prolyl oligopeptidase family serine peptidase [Acidobacteriota bacterium]